MLAIIRNIPLTLFLLIAYNLIAFGFTANAGGGADDPWAIVLYQVTLISGANWSLTQSDVMIIAGLILLFFEILKATRTSRVTIVDHLLSTLVLILFIVEFIVVAEAGTSTFFILGVIALVDVIAGYSISIRVASRDVAFSTGGGL